MSSSLLHGHSLFFRPALMEFRLLAVGKFLQVQLPRTPVCKSLGVHSLAFLLKECSGVECLGHMVGVCVALCEVTALFPDACTTSPPSLKEFLFLHVLDNICMVNLFNFSHSSGCV